MPWTSASSSSLPSKRPRERDDRQGRGSDGTALALELGTTPRARKTVKHRARHMDVMSDANAPSSMSESSYASSSNVSRRSSPTKQFRNAELQSTGFCRASFTISSADLPASLSSLQEDLTRIQNGEGIIPQSHMPELAHLVVPAYAFHADDSDHGQTPYLYPEYNLIRRLLHRAAECDVDNEGESSWNMDVHGPLLNWVLRDKPASGLLDYRYWCASPVVVDTPQITYETDVFLAHSSTSARIAAYFQPQKAPGKMIDFCFTIRPNAHEQDVINNVCQCRPSLTINHTDWGNLSKHPIALSIETKRQGEQLDEALLQIGTWHSSQWRSIRHGGSHDAARRPGNIEFLPGIIIHGHDWLFVATTLGEHLKATTYSSLRIGDTSSAFGIYKLLAALQRLASWCENTYWPAFKADVLGISGGDAEIVT